MGRYIVSHSQNWDSAILYMPSLRFSVSLHAHTVRFSDFSMWSDWDAVILAMPILGFTNSLHVLILRFGDSLHVLILRFSNSLHVLLLRFGDSLHDHTEIQRVIWSWKGFRIWMVWKNGACFFFALQGHRRLYSLLQNQQQLSQGFLSWLWNGCASNLVDRVAVFCGLWWCLGTPHVCFVLKFLLVDVWCCCSEEKGRFSYCACDYCMSDCFWKHTRALAKKLAGSGSHKMVDRDLEQE